MKREDRIVVPDNYERYEAMKRERSMEARITKLETIVKRLQQELRDK
jgi:hypothetical protein